MATSTKPLVLICSTPIYGHLMPIRAIAKELIARGYEITFVTGSAYRKVIEEIGATFFPLSGYADFTEAEIDTRWPVRKTLTPGPEQLTYDMEHVFVRAVPSQHEAQQAALKMLNETHPGRPIVLVNEAVYLGSIPGMLGAPGLRPTASLAIGVIPMTLNSIDCAPFGPGLPPDSSPEGRERNKAMIKVTREQILNKPDMAFKEAVESLGARKSDIFVFDTPFLCPDRFLQMCIPSGGFP
jgi:UDP:flavonoid glycosyltransferase YjiC (YdhE family)